MVDRTLKSNYYYYCYWMALWQTQKPEHPCLNLNLQISRHCYRVMLVFFVWMILCIIVLKEMHVQNCMMVDELFCVLHCPVVDGCIAVYNLLLKLKVILCVFPVLKKTVSMLPDFMVPQCSRWVSLAARLSECAVEKH